MTEINLDDIFAVVNTEPHSRKQTDSHISVHEAIGANRSASFASSQHSAVHDSKRSSIASQQYQPADPKSRSSTLQSSMKAQPPQKVHTTEVTHIINTAPSSDPFLDEIFKSVNLPEVTYVHQQTEERNVIDYLNSAIGHTNSTESRPQSVASSKSAHSSVSSLSGAVGATHIRYESDNGHHFEEHPEPEDVHYSNASSRRSSHHGAPHEQPNSKDSSRRSSHATQSTLHETQERHMQFQYEDDVSTLVGSEDNHEQEGYDHFQPDMVSFQPNNFRNRTFTMDSTVSGTESRVGDYTVQDEHGMRGQEPNLHHNDVAYMRPKPNKKANGVEPQPIPNQNFHTGGTWKVKQLKEDLNKAHQKELVLEAQVARSKKELDAMKQRQPVEQPHLSQRVTQRQSSVSSVESAPSHVSKQSKESHVSQKSDNYYGRQHTHEPTHDTPYRPASVTSKRSSVSSVGEFYERPATVQSAYSHSVDSIYEEQVGVSPLAQTMRDEGTEIDVVNDVAIIVPAHDELMNYAKDKKVKKVVFGGQQEPSIDDKTVLLFGPIGAGKTSVISSMLNYLYDVKKENDFRFAIKEEITQTTDLTAYVFNHTVLPFSVTVVDTPGVPDVKGTKMVSTLIKHWFENELLSNGAFRLDAISIVLTHDEANLGWPFILELAAVKKMFGDDLKTNVLPIITNSEVLPQPIAVRSLTQANIAFVEYYKVNNAGFMADSQGLPKLKHNLFYKQGAHSLENFFRDLHELIHPLLAVLRNRQSLKSPTVFDPAALY